MSSGHDRDYCGPTIDIALLRQHHDAMVTYHRLLRRLVEVDQGRIEMACVALAAMALGPTTHLLLAAGQPIPAWPVSAQPPLHADGDNVADFILLEPGFDATSKVFGRVVVRSGATGQDLFKIVGPEAGDDFAISACTIDDADADGVADIALCAPGAARGTANQGRIYICSGRTGELIRTLAGPSGEIFGVGVTRARAAEGPGHPIDSLLVLTLMSVPDPRFGPIET